MKKIAFAALMTVIALPLAKPALALDEVYSPNVEESEISVEYNGSRTFDGNQASKNDAEEHEFALEYGATSRWEVETSVGFTKDPEEDVKFNDVELENRFQFFDQGENWLDSGLLVAYDFVTQSQQPDTLEVKLLLQKDFGKITSTANIGFEQDVGHYAATGGPDYVTLWNTRYRYNEYFQPGVELQSDLGQEHMLNNFNQQSHYLGPAVYGRLFGHLQYQAGYYWGISDAAAQSAARLLLEYEMHF
jgi:hypothetical protein